MRKWEKSVGNINWVDTKNEEERESIIKWECMRKWGRKSKQYNMKGHEKVSENEKTTLSESAQEREKE